MASTNETSTPTHYETLAERLRAKRQSDEQEVEQILNEHVESLRQRSNTVLAEIEKSLESVQDETAARISKSVLPLALIWGAALLGILLSAVSAWYVNSQVNEIEKHRATLDKVPNLHLTKCGHHPVRQCVEIKTNAPTYGNHGQYRVIQQ